ncbi:MAG: Maf family protein [Verrucomicrobia bacterium]|nr:Maf family protein [Verrucomicrobiota bacterium]
MPAAKLILASASPRRRELLASLGVDFIVETADVVEWEAESADPAQLVQHNARIKAEAVARKFPDYWVLGADTTVALEHLVLNKPVNHEDAVRMLSSLSGREHRVLTAVCLHHYRLDKSLEWVDVSHVRFRSLDRTAIEHYMGLVHVFDKAGAYAFQEHGALIIESFSGSRSNIIGLPVESLQPKLVEVGLIGGKHAGN